MLNLAKLLKSEVIKLRAVQEPKDPVLQDELSQIMWFTRKRQNSHH